MKHYECVIVGGGASGLGVAITLKQQGITNILILEKEAALGGILNQCIHHGFGIEVFKESLPGPSFSCRLVNQVHNLKIPYQLKTTVIDINDHQLTFINHQGIQTVTSDNIVLACGCIERNRHQISLDGPRIAGIMSAGQAQYYLNRMGLEVGKRAIILGSGDVGLIMARRLTIEGIKVKQVVEINSYPSGLKRNIVQCLDDFKIPLLLEHTIVKVEGTNRLEGVWIAPVNNGIIDYSKQYYEKVDLLILAIGMFPDNQLALKAGLEIDASTKGVVVNNYYQTSKPFIYSCGNNLQVHDIVDKAYYQGQQVATNIIKQKQGSLQIRVIKDDHISLVVPQKVVSLERVQINFRVKKPLSKSLLKISQGQQTTVYHFDSLDPACLVEVNYQVKSSDDIILMVEEE